jgi:hypothetical protein
MNHSTEGHNNGHFQSNYSTGYGNTPSYLIPNEEDVESDVLSDSDDETSPDNPQPSVTSFNTGPQTDHDISQILHGIDSNQYLSTGDTEFDDDEVYQLFMQSVRDEQVAESIIAKGDDDDDDDDDFNPDPSDGSISEDDEYDYDDDMTEETEEPQVKVQTREIRDLLNECWLEIAGNKPSVPVNYQQTYSMNGNPMNALNDNNPSNDSSSRVPLSSGLHGNETNNSNNLLQNRHLLTSIVSQLFIGQKASSETYIDNLPVDSIRKLVAKQMSMALQLLIQLLLQADPQSECFEKSYQQLLILSNLRNSAVKKAKLFQMNLELLKNITQDSHRFKSLKDNEFQQILMEVVPTHQHQSLLSQQQQQKLQAQEKGQPQVSSSSSAVLKEDETNNNDSNQQSSTRRIMTRSCLINYDKQSHRSSSLFDIPILSRIHDFMVRIDEKKRFISNDLLPFVNHLTQQNHQLHHRQMPSLLPYGQSQALSFFEQKLKVFKFQLNEKYLKELFRQSQGNSSSSSYSGDRRLKLWNCLIPKANYPFVNYFKLLSSSSFVSSSSLSSTSSSFLNPLTIEGRKFFTPAEDDLLLKGIIEFGDENIENWESIHRKYLNFKKLELLQFHYHEKTLCSNLLQNNDFKRYQQLSERDKMQLGGASTANPTSGNVGNQLVSSTITKRREEKWNSIEDLYLLKGFQIFGEKYPLISLFFLTHRNAQEIRNR